MPGNALDLPYTDGSSDVVLLMGVLYHRAVPDNSTRLLEAMRVLRPRGVVLINVPGYEWLCSAHDGTVHTDCQFVRGEIWDLLDGAGFSVVSATY